MLLILPFSLVCLDETITAELECNPVSVGLLCRPQKPLTFNNGVLVLPELCTGFPGLCTGFLEGYIIFSIATQTHVMTFAGYLVPEPEHPCFSAIWFNQQK